MAPSDYFLHAKAGDDKLPWEVERKESPGSPMVHLPSELLVLILELIYLPRKNYYGHPDQRCLGTRDLLSTMRCCRRLNLMGQPVLWSRLVQTHALALPDVVRVALKRPELASHVRRVELNESKLGVVSAKRAKQNLESQKRVALLFPLLPAGFEEAMIEYDQWTLLAAFTLSVSQNVETLEINFRRDDCQKRLPLLGDVFASRNCFAGQSPFLPKLRELSMSFGRRPRSSGLNHLLQFLQHPSLEIFSGFNIRANDLPPDQGSDAIALPLKTIRLENCNIGTVCLVNLLECCPSLESFMYDHHHDHDHAVPEESFIPQLLTNVMGRLKPCLKELTLFRRERVHQSIHTVSANTLTTIGSLYGFNALTHLAITAHLLLGRQESYGSAWARHYEILAPNETHKLAHVLPRSLQKLRLMNCGRGVLQDVIDLVEQNDILVPNLRSIVLEFQDMMYNKYQGGFVDKTVRRATSHLLVNEKLANELEGLCGKKGIVLDIWYN